MTTTASTDMPTTSSSSQIQLLTTTPSSHPVVMDPKAQNQTHVSNQSSTVNLPRENITFTMYPPTNASDVLLPTGSITKRPRHRPPSPHNVVDVKAPEDQGKIPWLILKPAGQSLSKTHQTPRPRQPFTKPEPIVIPANVFLANNHSAEKNHHAVTDIPWLILKTRDQNEFSLDVDLFAKKPMYQPDRIKENPNPFYDDVESEDSLEPYPAMSLYSSADLETPEAAFSAESPQMYSSHSLDDDLDGHGQQVDIREDKNAIPWLILKSSNHHQPSVSNYHLADTENAPTIVRPVFNISRAPLPMSKSSIRSISHQSITKQTPVNYDHIPTNIVQVDAVNLKSQDQYWNSPGNRPSDGATNWMHSGLDKSGTTVDPQSYASTSESPIAASTTNPRRNHLPMPLRRNPLLAFDD